jgi:hypothetical protein
MKVLQEMNELAISMPSLGMNGLSTRHINF